MKKIITALLMILPCVSMADMSLDIRNQMLDSEIEKYTQIRDEKYEVLKQCEKSTQGFKIAGITTLVVTGVGVVANVKLSQKLNGTSSKGGGHLAVGSDGHEHISEQEAECRELSIMSDSEISSAGLTKEQINEYCSGTGYSV